MKPPPDLWEIIVDLGLTQAFPPQCVSYAMNAYARAVGACERLGHSYRTIRVEVVGRLVGLRFRFNGNEWAVYRFDSDKSRTPMSGRSYLEREEEPLVPLEEIVFTGEEERFMLVKNTYYMGYIKLDGTWKIEQSENLNHLAERFNQVTTNVRPPPKEVRLYMDAVHPDGTKYEHDIAKFSR